MRRKAAAAAAMDPIGVPSATTAAPVAPAPARTAPATGGSTLASAVSALAGAAYAAVGAPVAAAPVSEAAPVAVTTVPAAAAGSAAAADPTAPVTPASVTAPAAAASLAPATGLTAADASPTNPISAALLALSAPPPPAASAPAARAPLAASSMGDGATSGSWQEQGLAWWQSRWTEMENSAAVVEEERDGLKIEVQQLRAQLAEQARTMKPASMVPSPESEALQEALAKLDEARKQAEERHDAVRVEKEISAALRAELQQRVADVSKLSMEKVHLETERSVSQSTALPVEAECERLRRQSQEDEQRIASLKAELAGEQAKLKQELLEKAGVVRDLNAQLEKVSSESALCLQSAEAAQAAKTAAVQQVAAADSRLQSQTAAFGEALAALEKKVDLQSTRLKQADDKVAELEGQLALAAQTTAEVQLAREAADSQVAALKAQVKCLEENAKKAQCNAPAVAKGDDTAQKHVPQGLATEAPLQGLPSSSALAELSVSREALLAERHAKEQLTEAIQALEKKVREREPVLARQLNEVPKLRRVTEQLTRQNEGLLERLQDAERSEREAKGQSAEARQSVHILEKHAREMARQLSVILHENHKLTGVEPRRLADSVHAQDPPDAAHKTFRNVQDLVEQNEALRRAVTRLMEGCETAAQVELRGIRDEQDRRTAEWEERLVEKDLLVAAFRAKAERLALEEREFAAAQCGTPAVALSTGDTAARISGVQLGEGEEQQQQQLQLPAAEAQAEVHPQQRETALRDQLTTVRKEFVTCREVLHRRVSEARTCELEARQKLITTQTQLDSELCRKRDLEVSLDHATRRLEERQIQLQTLEARVKQLEDGFRREERRAQDYEAAIGQINRDKQHLESHLRLERRKLGALEQSSASLLADKFAHVHTLVDLQAKLAAEASKYGDMRQTLQESYAREDGLLKEQLELSDKQQEDLKRINKELCAARDERKQEAAEAKARNAKLDEDLRLMQTQLAERSRALEEFRAAGGTRPRRVAELAAETESQARQVRIIEETAELERQRVEAERASDPWINEEMWKNLVASHEAEIEAQRIELEKLRAEVNSVREDAISHTGDVEAARAREAQIQARVRDVEEELGVLRAAAARKDEEVRSALATGRKEGEVMARDAETRLEVAERESGSDEWRRCYRQALEASNVNINALNASRKECAAQAEQVRQLERRATELEATIAHAGKGGAPTVESKLSRSAEAEDAVQLLATVSQQESTAGAKGFSAVPREEIQLDNQRLQAEKRALQGELEYVRLRLNDKEAEIVLIQQGLPGVGADAEHVARLAEQEDEGRRLAAEVRSLRARLEERASLEVQRQEVALARLTKGHQKKEETWAKQRVALDAQVESAKKLHEDVSSRLSKEMAFVKELSSEKEAQQAALRKQFEATKQELARNQNELKQRSMDSAKIPAQDAKAGEQDAEVKRLVTELRRKEPLIELGRKRIDQLEKTIATMEKKAAEHEAAQSKLKHELDKLRSEAQNVPAAAEGQKEAQLQADKALSLAADYRSALDKVQAETRAQGSAAHKAAPLRDASKAAPQSAAAGSASSILSKRKDAPESSALAAAGMSPAAAASRAPPAKVARVADAPAAAPTASAVVPAAPAAPAAPDAPAAPAALASPAAPAAKRAPAAIGLSSFFQKALASDAAPTKVSAGMGTSGPSPAAVGGSSTGAAGSSAAGASSMGARVAGAGLASAGAADSSPAPAVTSAVVGSLSAGAASAGAEGGGVASAGTAMIVDILDD